MVVIFYVNEDKFIFLSAAGELMKLKEGSAPLQCRAASPESSLLHCSVSSEQWMHISH